MDRIKLYLERGEGLVQVTVNADSRLRCQVLGGARHVLKTVGFSEHECKNRKIN